METLPEPFGIDSISSPAMAAEAGDHQAADLAVEVALLAPDTEGHGQLNKTFLDGETGQAEGRTQG